MKANSSWESVGNWYDKIVGDAGHYYHQQIILPGVLRLLNFNKTKPARVLDLACGQGILSRKLPKETTYVGVDASPTLIKAAAKYTSSKKHTFITQDVTKSLDLPKDFTHAAIILALQNIANPLAVFQNFNLHLVKNGKLVIVLNHPCFRIPRQSSWQIDEKKKTQYRRIDRYYTPLEIPIQAHPSQKDSTATMTFHHPLSSYTLWLKEAGFVIEHMEEWLSDKMSTGKNAKMENRARKEFPLFLTLVAQKNS